MYTDWLPLLYLLPALCFHTEPALISDTPQLYRSITLSTYTNCINEHLFPTLEIPEGKESESWHTTFQKLLTPD